MTNKRKKHFVNEEKGKRRHSDDQENFNMTIVSLGIITLHLKAQNLLHSLMCCLPLS